MSDLIPIWPLGLLGGDFIIMVSSTHGQLHDVLVQVFCSTLFLFYLCIDHWGAVVF